MSGKDKEPVGQIVAELHHRLALVELDRDEWKGQVVAIRAQQREALARAEAAEAELRGIRFRVDAACSGYEHLLDDDVPASDDPASYQNGSERAARAIRMALDGDKVAPRETVPVGSGDDLDVAAGRCCPSCRISLAKHNRDVWNAGYTIGQRHALSDLALAWDDGWLTAWTPMSPHGRDHGPNPYRHEAEHHARRT